MQLGEHTRGAAGDAHDELVEIRRRETGGRTGAGECRGERARAREVVRRDVAQARLSRRREVDRRAQRAVGLIGANIRGRFFAPNMLLARLQRQHVRRLAVLVDGFADEAPRDAAQMFGRRRDETDVRAAVGDRNAERLALADANIHAPRGRGRKRGKRDGFGHDADHERSGRLDRRDVGGRERIDRAEEVRRLHDHRGITLVGERGRQRRGVGRTVRGIRQLLDVEVEPVGVGLEHRAIVRMDGARDEQRFAPRRVHRHDRTLGERRRAVVDRGVGDVEAGEQRDVGLPLVDRLEVAL